MKKNMLFLALMMSAVMLFMLAGCGSKTEVTEATEELAVVLTWQEQYDLGMKYLSEGNYEEAIIAFTAAIEIEPKESAIYLGRAEAYMNCVELPEAISLAQGDYKKAIELDKSNPLGYLGLAEIYIIQDDFDSAIAILEDGFTITKDERCLKQIEELNSQLEGVGLSADIEDSELSNVEVSGLSNAEVLNSVCGLWDYSGNEGKSQDILMLAVTIGENGLCNMTTGLLASEIIGQYTVSAEGVVYQGNDMYALETQGTATKKLSIDMSDPDNIILRFEDESNQYFYYVGADVNEGMSAMEEKYFWAQSYVETSPEVTVETPVVESQTSDEKAASELATKVAAYCNELMAALGDDGTYVIFDSEIYESDTEYMFVVRYQISSEQAEKIIADGGMPSANRVAGEAIVEKATGTATWGNYTWNIYA